MPIITSRIDEIENGAPGPGRMRVHEFFEDQTGRIYINRYDVPLGYDTAQQLADQVVFRDTRLLIDEKRNVQLDVKEGADPATITVDHITANEKLASIVNGFMFGVAQDMAVAAAWLNASVSNGELDTAVGTDRRVVVRNRETSVLGLQTDLDADEALRDDQPVRD